jgi:hypothetical protein
MSSIPASHLVCACVAACLLAACDADVAALASPANPIGSRPVSRSAEADREQQTAFAQALFGDAKVQVIVLDMEVLGSVNAAVREASRAHAAPGEAEHVLLLVRSRRPYAAAMLARDLIERGFDPVLTIGAPS